MFDDLLVWLSKQSDSNIYDFDVDRCDSGTEKSKAAQAPVFTPAPIVHTDNRDVDRCDNLPLTTTPYTDTPDFKDWSRRPFKAVPNETGMTALDVIKLLPTGKIDREQYLKAWQSFKNKPSN